MLQLRATHSSHHPHEPCLNSPRPNHCTSQHAFQFPAHSLFLALPGVLQETAINIGFACSLLRNDMSQYIISANSPEVIALEDAGRLEAAYQAAKASVGAQLEQAAAAISEGLERGEPNALVIDGKALLHALTPELKSKLLEVCPTQCP